MSVNVCDLVASQKCLLGRNNCCAKVLEQAQGDGSAAQVEGWP